MRFTPLLLLALLATPARAQSPTALAESGPYRPRLILVDMPYNRRDWPSMMQSLETSRALVEGGNWALDLGGEWLERRTHPILRWLIEVPLLASWNGAHVHVSVWCRESGPRTSTPPSVPNASGIPRSTASRSSTVPFGRTNLRPVMPLCQVLEKCRGPGTSFLVKRKISQGRPGTR
jgi:hypothetical protein